MCLHIYVEKTIHRCYQKAPWVGHIYECVITQCAEMCLHGNVAKTHLPVLLKSTMGWTHKCVIAQCAEMCLHSYVAKTQFVQWKSLIFCV